MASKCHFAHGRDELRSPNDPLPPSVTYLMDTKLPNVDSYSNANANPLFSVKPKFLWARNKRANSATDMPDELKERLSSHEGVQSLLVAKSLEFAIDQLHELHASEDQLVTQLNMCSELLSAGNLPACASHLEGTCL